MHKVPDFHGIVVEVSSICLVWRSKYRYLQPSETSRRAVITYLITQLSPTTQYLPKEMTTACPGPVRLRSPRMIAELDIIVFPPRIMFCGPAIVALLDTLLPVSYVD